MDVRKYRDVWMCENEGLQCTYHSIIGGGLMRMTKYNTSYNILVELLSRSLDVVCNLGLLFIYEWDFKSSDSFLPGLDCSNCMRSL